MNQLLGPDVVALKSELSLFDPPPVQFSVLESQFVHLQPQHGLSAGAPIEFEIQPAGDLYLDLQETVLNVSIRVIDATGKAIEADKNYVCLENLAIASLFQDVQLCIGDSVIEGGSFLYPYKSILLSLLEYGSCAQKAALPPWGFYKDTAGESETMGDANVGRKSRRALIAGGRLCTLSGPLFLDLFRQPRYLLSKSNLRLKLIPSDTKFVLSGAGIGDGVALKDYLVSIERVELRLHYVLPSPSVLAAHAQGLKKHNALYPLNGLQMSTFTIPSGSLSYTRENLFQGGVPKLLLLAFVSNKAFNGSMDSNPFNFQHANVSSIGVFVNGESVPARPMQVNLAKDTGEVEYTWLLQQLGMYMQSRELGFKMDEYARGYGIFAFNLCSELGVGVGTQLYKEGSVRLELRFGAATTLVYNVIVGGLFDKQLQLTEFRDVVPGSVWK